MQCSIKHCRRFIGREASVAQYIDFESILTKIGQSHSLFLLPAYWKWLQGICKGFEKRASFLKVFVYNLFFSVKSAFDLIAIPIFTFIPVVAFDVVDDIVVGFVDIVEAALKINDHPSSL